MKKRLFCTILTVFTLMILLAQSAFARTETVIIKPEYTEDTVVAISFKDGQIGYAEYIYTGEKIKPEITVTKVDKTTAKPSEYKVTYDDNCQTPGLHSVTVEYLKSGYIVSMDYYVVPGKTDRVDVTTKNGNVTLSWSAVKGANYYRVYEYSSANGGYVEVLWEDGSIASPKLSRTFSNLEAGKTYKMAIMALEKANSMPTKQMKTFQFTVPESGNDNTDAVPGTNEKPKETTTNSPTIKETQTNTSAVSINAEPAETTETTATPKTTVANTEDKTVFQSTTTANTAEDTTQSIFDAKIIIPVFAVIGIAAVATTVIFIKKKKK